MSNSYYEGREANPAKDDRLARILAREGTDRLTEFTKAYRDAQTNNEQASYTQANLLRASLTEKLRDLELELELFPIDCQHILGTAIQKILNKLEKCPPFPPPKPNTPDATERMDEIDPPTHLTTNEPMEVLQENRDELLGAAQIENPQELMDIPPPENPVEIPMDELQIENPAVLPTASALALTRPETPKSPAGPVQEPVKEPAKRPTKGPVQEPGKEPAKRPTKGPVQEPVKEPVKEATKEPLQKRKKKKESTLRTIQEKGSETYTRDGPIIEPVKDSSKGPEDKTSKGPLAHEPPKESRKRAAEEKTMEPMDTDTNRPNGHNCKKHCENVLFDENADSSDEEDHYYNPKYEYKCPETGRVFKKIPPHPKTNIKGFFYNPEYDERHLNNLQNLGVESPESEESSGIATSNSESSIVTHTGCGDDEIEFMSAYGAAAPKRKDIVVQTSTIYPSPGGGEGRSAAAPIRILPNKDVRSKEPDPKQTGKKKTDYKSDIGSANDDETVIYNLKSISRNHIGQNPIIKNGGGKKKNKTNWNKPNEEQQKDLNKVFKYGKATHDWGKSQEKPEKTTDTEKWVENQVSKYAQREEEYLQELIEKNEKLKGKLKTGEELDQDELDLFSVVMDKTGTYWRHSNKANVETNTNHLSPQQDKMKDDYRHRIYKGANPTQADGEPDEETFNMAQLRLSGELGLPPPRTSPSIASTMTRTRKPPIPPSPLHKPIDTLPPYPSGARTSKLNPIAEEFEPKPTMSSPKMPTSTPATPPSTTVSDEPEIINMKILQTGLARECRTAVTQQRPVEKSRFNGDLTKFDYDIWRTKFNSVMNQPGITYEIILGELPHWFCGVAAKAIELYENEQPAEKQYNLIMNELDRLYGNKANIVDNMLLKILGGPEVHKTDQKEVTIFLLDLKKFELNATKTSNRKLLDAPDTIHRIIRKRIPSLKNRWAKEISRKKSRWDGINEEDRDMTFKEFISFIEEQLDYTESLRYVSGNDEKKKPTPAPAAKTKAINSMSSTQKTYKPAQNGSKGTPVQHTPKTTISKPPNNSKKGEKMNGKFGTNPSSFPKKKKEAPKPAVNVANAEKTGNGGQKNKGPQPKTTNKEGQTGATAVKSSKDWTCPHCGSKSYHILDVCNTFLTADIQRKHDMMKRGGHCYKCLARNHLAMDCEKEVVRCDKCMSNRHHTLLHDDNWVKK